MELKSSDQAKGTSHPKQSQPKSCHVWLIAQIMLSAALIFLPFGFDHPSKLGLDFGHLLLLAMCFTVAFIGCIALSIAQKRHVCLVASVFAALIGFVLFVCFQD